jgi:phage repressor protein C with HTH and peptisase S24 domain
LKLPAAVTSRFFFGGEVPFCPIILSILELSNNVKKYREVFLEILRIVESAENLIETQGFDKSSLAKKLGFPSRYIADIKAGKSKNPGSDFILALINRLNFNPLWLETGEGDMFLLNKTKYEFTPRIRQIRELLSLDQAEFAKKLGISRGSLIDYERGGAVPSSIIERLQEKFSVNHEWFTKGVGEPFYHQTGDIEKPKPTSVPVYHESELPEGAFIVPLLDQRLSAGSGSYLPEEDEATALVHVPAYLSRYGKNIKALTVDGDSMYPTLHRGDMVVCDSCGWSGEGVYALKMSGDGYVKRLTKKPGKIVIISDNPKYPPQEEPEESQDIEIIGRVHCAIVNME